MNRVSNYYYDDKDKLTRVEVHETYEASDLCDVGEDCDEGVLLEDTIDVPCETISPMGMAAVVLSSISIGISIARLLLGREEK